MAAVGNSGAAVVLHTLMRDSEHHTVRIDKHDDRLGAIEVELAVVKTKVALYAALGAAGSSGIVSLLTWFLTR